MNTIVLRVLNHHAKAWCYYKDDRAKQREAIIRDLKQIRAILATKDAYQVLGQGENGVHYEEIWGDNNVSRCSSSRYSDDMATLYAMLGVPTIDCRPADFKKLCKVSISGPMIAYGTQEPDETSHALAFRPLVEVARGYRDAGCIVSNLNLD